MSLLPGFLKKRVEQILARRRRARVFNVLDRKGEGLEIGPCHNALAPKRDGFNVRILDHLDQEGLRKKYQDHPAVDVDRIEPVDYVWSGQSYAELVGETRFDWIIASHVIEHVPDLIAFVSECEGILRDGGRLFLVVPHCEREFDRFRYPSGCGEVVDAHLRRDVRPTPGTVAEHHLRAVTKGGRHAWPSWWPGSYRKLHTTSEVADAMRAAQEGEYRDVHIWRFTPDSFQRLFDELAELGLVAMRVEGEIHVSGFEFSVCLRKEK